MTSGLANGQIRGACPLDCPDTCSWIVTVKNGAPVSLRGDPAHPYTHGALCNKVADYLVYARSPDRLLYPLRRTGPKGSGEFTRISWDEALERIAASFGDAIAKHGAEAIWPYAGTGNMGLIQGIYGAGRRLWNVLGASRHVVTICTISGGFGTGYTLGDNRVGLDPETFRFSKLIVLWGANVLSTHHHLWRFVLEARKNGRRLSRLTLFVPGPPRPATGTLHRSLEPMRPLRSACFTSSWPKAKRTGNSSPSGLSAGRRFASEFWSFHHHA